MAIFERPYDSLEELHETELEYLKTMFYSGVPLAVPAAMHYCAKHGLNAPRWLVIESTKMHCTYLCGNAPKKRGRSSGIVNRNRQDAIDFARWDTVVEIREYRKLLQKEVDTLRALAGRRARDVLKEYMKMLDWTGTNDLSAFECVSMLQAETYAHCGPDAMKTSYRKAEKGMRDPATAMRYRVLDPDFLRIVGTSIDQSVNQGKKIVPLYDLTI